MKFKPLTWKPSKQNSSTTYYMADGTTLHITYDEYGNTKVGREFLEWCLAHVNENIKRESK